MKAPEKIYLTSNENEAFVFTQKRSDNKGIEYTRTDAFIEKTCKWLRNNSHNYADNALGKEYLVNDFKNYMKEDR